MSEQTTETAAPKTRKPRAAMSDGRLEIHVMTKAEDWLSRLDPAARRRVVTWLADRARQLDIIEAHGVGKAVVRAMTEETDTDLPTFGRAR